MAEFICNNENCKNKGIKVSTGITTYRIVGDRFVADERFCLLCKQEMEEIKSEDKSFGGKLVHFEILANRPIY